MPYLVFLRALLPSILLLLTSILIISPMRIRVVLVIFPLLSVFFLVWLFSRLRESISSIAFFSITLWLIILPRFFSGYIFPTIVTSDNSTSLLWSLNLKYPGDAIIRVLPSPPSGLPIRVNILLQFATTDSQFLEISVGGAPRSPSDDMFDKEHLEIIFPAIIIPQDDIRVVITQQVLHSRVRIVVRKGTFGTFLGDKGTFFYHSPYLLEGVPFAKTGQLVHATPLVWLDTPPI